MSSALSDTVRCNICSYESGPRELMTHIIRRHKYDARFSVYCCFRGCSRLHPYKKWNSFRRHIRRKHQGVIIVLYSCEASTADFILDDVELETGEASAEDAAAMQQMETDGTDYTSDTDLPSSSTFGTSTEQWNAARFLLHCTTRFSMSYSAVDEVAGLTEDLVQQVTESLATRVSTVMDEHGGGNCTVI